MISAEVFTYEGAKQRLRVISDPGIRQRKDDGKARELGESGPMVNWRCIR